MFGQKPQNHKWDTVLNVLIKNHFLPHYLENQIVFLCFPFEDNSFPLRNIDCSFLQLIWQNRGTTLRLRSRSNTGRRQWNRKRPNLQALNTSFSCKYRQLKINLIHTVFKLQWEALCNSLKMWGFHTFTDPTFRLKRHSRRNYVM